MHKRPATMVDADVLFEWRNDPLTRSMCLHTEPVAWDEHLHWLERILVNPSCELMIYESNGIRCGTTRLDWTGEAAEFNVTVAPTFRGRFVVKSMLELALPKAAVIAHIKRENVACQRLTAWFGFTLVEDGPVQLWTRPARAQAA